MTGDSDSWDFGVAARFYLEATERERAIGGRV
jgi:hypothetical protein